MIFTIKKGQHYSSPRLFKNNKVDQTLTGSFKLEQSCWYDTKVVGTHLNKWVGFSTDLFNLNSIRISWRPAPIPFTFEVYIYIHLNGAWVRSYPLKDDLVGVYNTDLQFFSIVISGEKAPNLIMRMFGKSSSNQTAILTIGQNTVEKAYPVSVGIGWMMWPYFGGKPTAPQNMSGELDYKWEENNF